MIIYQLKENVVEIKLTDGDQFRDFIYIDDVVSAYLCVIEQVENLGYFSNFDVGSGKLVSIKDFLLQLKLRYEILFSTSETTLKFGAIPYRTAEMMTVNVNIQPLFELGWRPLNSIDEGMEKLLKSFFSAT